MKKFKVAYIGNMYEIAEEIYFSENFELKSIMYEKGRLTNELFTLHKVRSIPLTELKNPQEILTNKDKSIDLFIMCSYGRKIPREVLKKTVIYNIHYGLLPNYKGRHPSFYSFLNNEKYHGISLHKVSKDIDCGEIIETCLIPNKIQTTENSLFQRTNKKNNTPSEKSI